jgi:predicted nucleotidyltransferase
LIVEFKETKSFIEHIQIEQELEEITGRIIDLLTQDSIDPYLKSTILAESKVIGP